jgi:betaine-aldehyde dehydrogenase
VSVRSEPSVAPMYIGGEWVAGDGAVQAAVDPATEETLGYVPIAQPADVDRAVVAATAAAPAWASLPWGERSRLLRELAHRVGEHAERLAHIDTANAGFPIPAMRRDVAIAADWLLYFAGIAGEAKGTTYPSGAGVLHHTRREPYAVSGRIIPYNHPLMFAVQKSAAPLAAGSCVVLKPAEQTSLSALEFARLTEDLLPAGVFNVVTGTGRVTGEAIVAHPGIRRIAFTGGGLTGRKVLHTAADEFKHVTLELGGKNPLVVFPDADPVAAASAAVRSMNLRESTGQSCRSTSRMFVHDAVHDEFVDHLLRLVADLRVGDPRDEHVDVGPLAFREHFEHVRTYIEAGLQEGATLALGGRRPLGLEKGFFLEPTVFTDVEARMRIAREEVFGPVMAVIRWTDEEDMLTQANDNELGLTANIWTNDLSKAHRTAARLQAGLVWVNGVGRVPPGIPFGGYKHSGIGKEGAVEELLSYTQEKSVLIDLMSS